MEKTEGESDKKYGVNHVYFHYLLKKKCKYHLQINYCTYFFVINIFSVMQCTICTFILFCHFLFSGENVLV